MASGIQTSPSPSLWQAANGHDHNHNHSRGNGSSPPDEDKSMPIAIVGMSFRGPADATSVQSLWKMICEGREGWSEIPKERWNNDAFYHPDNTRHGTINVKGGHFFSEDLARFDAPFFNMTSTEAAALDPQQRLLLEGTFEAFENGGIPLDRVMGSKTSCFVGSFCGDYTDMLLRDPDTVPMHQCTNAGQSRAITANRVSYFFDLKGPSVTVDTACSGSLVALHLACQSLRTGDAKMAVAAGVNTILSHEFMSTMSMMRFLSPDGRCYTFDERANGYARGEGVGCLILKPLRDALNDNDTIRAVIRGSGSNQDGKTSGITLPSGTAQEELARSVYAAAGLSPLETEYVECHGTGTQAGDPQETGALSRVFAGPARPPDRPLRIGSIKTNVGHLEGASGIAGVIKSVLMLENRMFAPNRNFEKLNPRIPLERWKLKVQLNVEPWETHGPHRISVNSFGYGGSNAHVILEDTRGYISSHHLDAFYRLVPRVSNLLHPSNGNFPLEVNTRANGNGTANGSTALSHQPSRTRLFTLASFDEPSGKSQAERLKQYLLDHADEADDKFLTDLAFTLNNRRTAFMWKAAIPGKSSTDLADNLAKGVTFSRSTKKPTIGFVFTGQGAQWCGMGKELLDSYPVFRASIDRIGAYLKSLGAPFDVEEEITRDPRGSQINEALYSQPMCSAVQIAIVDLLSSWGIRPASVTGHSSGEIAAAYTAGTLTMEDAMAVAYYRGVASSHMQNMSQVKGSMMAVGLSKEDAETYLAAVKTGRAVVACVNSPSSVTISGDATAIDELKDILDEKKLFARKLAVEVAYHSHHMEFVADEYRALISGISPKSNDNESEDETTDAVEFFSSVTGAKGVPSDLGPEYWVQNMLGQVKFSDSVRRLCLETTDPSVRAKGANKKIRRRAGAASKASVNQIVEIGPHSALAGPIRQILKADQNLNSASIAYSSALIRKADAIVTVLQLAGNLLTAGWPVDLTAVNSPDGVTKEYEVQTLVDLPPYPWNHTNTYWAEPRLSKVYRNRKFPRTDLLGVLDSHSSILEPRWRNHIRTAEIPWVKDHKIQSNIVYPAAGYVVMAIEAAWQWASEHVPDKTITGYSLREVNIDAALVLNEQTATEVMVSLRPHRTSARRTSKLWREFSVASVTEANKWTEHASGLIQAHYDSGLPHDPYTDPRQLQKAMVEADKRCIIEVSAKEFYAHLTELGLEYGDTFANMTAARSVQDQCIAEITIPDTAATMPLNFEYPFIIHPSTLDSMFHPIFVALSAERGLIQGPAVPVSIEEMFVSQALTSKPGHKLDVYAFTEKKDDSNLVASIFAVDKQGSRQVSGIEGVGLSIKGMTCRVLPRDTGDGTEDERLRVAYNIKWIADPDLLTPAEIYNLCAASTPLPDEELEKFQLYHDCASVYIAEALAPCSIENGDVANGKSHLQKLRAFLDTQGSARTTAGAHSADSKALLVSNTKASGPEGELVAEIAQQLPAICRKDIHPDALTTACSRLQASWSETHNQKRNYEAVAKYLSILGDKDPHLSILEINAGSGGLSSLMLEALNEGASTSARFKRYTYTDPNDDVLEAAREKLSKWASLIKFKQFDVEGSDIQEQGLEPGSYDVIVLGRGLNLNRAKPKGQVLKNVRSLLRDGGRLVFVDKVHGDQSLARSMVLGTLVTWWEKEVEGKRSRYAFTEEEWHHTLRNGQFSGLDVCLHDPWRNAGYVSSVMITRAVGELSEVSSPEILLIVEDGDCGIAINLLAQYLEGINMTVRISTLAQADPLGRICIVLSGLRMPIFEEPEAPLFELVKSIFLRSKGVLWVTRGGSGPAVVNPNAGLVTGFARTARAETDGSSILTLDLDGQRALSSEQAAETIFSLFRNRLAGSASTIPQDVEYIERDGVLHIPRVVENDEVNGRLLSILQPASPIDQPFYEPGRKLRAVIGTPGQFSSVHFVDDTTLAETPEDYVRIQVKASGLNKKDLRLIKDHGQGQYALGTECSGVVLEVGKSVVDFSPGDRVSCLGLGTITNYYQDKASSFQKIPDDMTFEQASALPLAYSTAYHVVYNLARITRSDKVLIHDIAGSTGQAIVEFCKLIGADIFGTVDNTSQKEYITRHFNIPDSHLFFHHGRDFAKEIMWVTGNKGIEVIVNSLAEDIETLSLSWNCIAPYGRFIDLNAGHQMTDNSRLEMANFSKDALFASFDLFNLLKNRRHLAHKLWADVMCLVRAKAIRGPASLLVHKFSDMETALTEREGGASIGKVVIYGEPGIAVKALAKDKSNELLRPDASYLLVGGLGGIGRATASWMIDHGARFLIFANRSGLSREESKETVRQLEANGAKVAVYSCDISKEDHLSTMMVKAAHEMPPIRGVIQAAMVLRDNLIEKLSVEDYSAAVSPKFLGTWNLHNHLPKDMDFFVMLSSVSGVIGNATQAAYAAGNTFMDGFAAFRNHLGLPAVTLDLGVIVGVGYLSENKELLAAMERQGFEGTDERTLMALIQTAIAQPRREGVRAQIVTGLGTWKEGQSLGNFDQSLFAHFRRRSLRDGKADGDEGDAADRLQEGLRASKTVDEAAGIICAALIDKIASRLGTPAENINSSKALSEYGVDSLVAVEIRTWIAKEMGSTIPILELLASASFLQLSTKIATRSTFVKLDVSV